MGSINRCLLALAALVLLAPFAQAQELDGTWKIVMRKLPDGTTLAPPAVVGVYTIHHGLQKLNVFWHTPEGKPASYARVSTYKMSDTDYSETVLFIAFDDGSELDLRILLGTAWMALRGWAAQEVWGSFFPALGLANSLRRNDALVPILRGLFGHVLNRELAESLRWVTQLMNAAETYRDPDLLIAGHTAAVTAYFWLGDPIKAREHADRVLALYSEERHGHLVGISEPVPSSRRIGPPG